MVRLQFHIYQSTYRPARNLCTNQVDWYIRAPRVNFRSALYNQILLTLLLILTVYGIYHSFLNRDIDIALLFSENSIVTLREYVNFKHAIKLVNVNIILNFLIPLLSFSAFFIGIKDNPNLKKMIIFTFLNTINNHCAKEVSAAHKGPKSDAPPSK